MAALLAIDYLFYLSYIARVMPRPLPSLCSPITGCLGNIKKSSFRNFDRVKNSGVIRIGCFGDSFTHGDEVSDIYDYPTLLQGIFRKGGYDNVEVINFGIGGIGFHQVFNIWKFIGRGYELDYIILGPGSFQRHRDSTFTASTEYDIKDGIMTLHARYILRNKDAELVDLTGDSDKARITNYLSFIPHRKYLLYDMLPPAFLAAPAYCLSRGMSPKHNPFYYRNDLKKEMREIHKILLNKMAGGIPQLILCHYNDEIVDIGNELDKDNLSGFLPCLPQSFPYKTAYGHNSPLCNQLLAEQLFECLTGKRESIQSVIETVTATGEGMDREPARKRRLCDYEDIGIEIGGVRLGRFYCSAVAECESEADAFSGIASVIAFPDKSGSIMDSLFLALELEINDGAGFTMKMKNINGFKEFLLPKVELLYPGVSIGVMDSSRFSFERNGNLLVIKKSALKNYTGSPDIAGEVVISLEGVPVLSAKFSRDAEEAEFHPVNGRFLTIAADGGKMLDVSRLERTGTIYVFLDGGDGGYPLKIPLARWIKTDKEVSFGRPLLYPMAEKGYHL